MFYRVSALALCSEHWVCALCALSQAINAGEKYFHKNVEFLNKLKAHCGNWLEPNVRLFSCKLAYIYQEQIHPYVSPLLSMIHRNKPNLNKSVFYYLLLFPYLFSVKMSTIKYKYYTINHNNTWKPQRRAGSIKTEIHLGCFHKKREVSPNIVLAGQLGLPHN